MGGRGRRLQDDEDEGQQPQLEDKDAQLWWEGLRRKDLVWVGTEHGMGWDG